MRAEAADRGWEAEKKTIGIALISRNLGHSRPLASCSRRGADVDRDTR